MDLCNTKLNDKQVLHWEMEVLLPTCSYSSLELTATRRLEGFGSALSECSAAGFQYPARHFCKAGLQIVETGLTVIQL